MVETDHVKSLQLTSICLLGYTVNNRNKFPFISIDLFIILINMIVLDDLEAQKSLLLDLRAHSKEAYVHQQSPSYNSVVDIPWTKEAMFIAASRTFFFYG